MSCHINTIICGWLKLLLLVRNANIRDLTSSSCWLAIVALQVSGPRFVWVEIHTTFLKYAAKKKSLIGLCLTERKSAILLCTGNGMTLCASSCRRPRILVFLWFPNLCIVFLFLFLTPEKQGKVRLVPSCASLVTF